MRKTLLVPFVAAGLTLLLGPTPTPAAGTINDLHQNYFGKYHSTNGAAEGGTASLAVTGKEGKNFTGDLSYSEAMAVGATGLGDIAVEGSVSPKGKIAMKGEIPSMDGTLKLNLKGTLSDGGQVIVAAYSIKRGKQTVFSAICYLDED